MKTRTVAYATQALSPRKVSSGASHHRSVRNVFAAMAARARAPSGFVAVDVIRVVSLTGPSRAADHVPFGQRTGGTGVHCHVFAHTNDRTGMTAQLSDTRYADLHGPAAQRSVPCVPQVGKTRSMINVRWPEKIVPGGRRTVSRRRRR
ncbi:hypothetical protein GCM10027259_15920 [Micromonospora palomenae]